MMYHFWTKHGIRPSVFYNMDRGEQLVIKAFYEHEIEEKNEKYKNMKNQVIFPVYVV